MEEKEEKIMKENGAVKSEKVKGIGKLLKEVQGSP